MGRKHSEANQGAWFTSPKPPPLRSNLRPLIDCTVPGCVVHSLNELFKELRIYKGRNITRVQLFKHKS